MNGVSQIVGSLMMYGIGQAKMSMAPWRVLFLICGGLTSATGVAFIFLMPRNPMQAWFLTEKEKSIVIQRLAKDRGTGDRAEFNKAQAIEALLSPMTWLFLLMACSITLTTPIIKVRFSPSRCLS
jgi:MFS transporter, ACS family, allantoate permease